MPNAAPTGYNPDNFPTSYTDPTYDKADQAASSAMGIPAAMLTAVRTKGERSNADQISSASGATPYQIVPATRNAIIAQTGIDPYLSPQTAAMGAAYILKQNMDRSGGNPVAAIAQYTGGNDPSQWGPATKAYVKRTTGYTPSSYTPGQTPNPFQLQSAPDVGTAPGSIGSTPAPAQQSDDPYQLQPAPQVGSAPGSINSGPSALEQAYQAYKGGQMAPQDAAQFEQDVNAGRVVLPSGMSVNAPKPQAAGNDAAIMPMAPQQAVDAFNKGQMAPEDAAQFQKDIASNNIALPPGATLSPPQPGAGRMAGVGARGLLEGLGEGIGGVVDRAKGIIDAPMNAVNAIAGGQGPLQTLDQTFGTHFSSTPAPAGPLAGAPNAAAQIPGMEQGAEAAANKLGLPVAQTPGEQVMQAGARGAGLMAQPFPGAGLAKLPALVAAGAAGGAVGETVHQQTGNQALGLAANLLTTALSPMAASRVMKALIGEVGARDAAAGVQGAEPTMPAAAEEAPAAQGAPSTGAPAAAEATTAAPEEAAQATEAASAQPPESAESPAADMQTEEASAQPAQQSASEEAASPTEEGAAQSRPDASATPLVPDDPEARKEIVSLMQNASGQNRTLTPAQVQDARNQLLDRFQINPQAADAARELGMIDDLHPDHLATDIQMIKLNQLLKSDPTNPMAAQEAQGLTRVGNRAIDLFNQMGAAPDISSLSQKASQLLSEQNQSLKGSVKNILDEQIPSMVPKTSQVPATNSMQLINQELDNLGGKSALLSRDWRRAQALLSPSDEPVTVSGQQIPGSKLGIAPTNPTYHAIDTLRKQLNAADKGAGPFVNMEQGSRRALAQALSKDQGAYLQSASPEAYGLWRDANAKVGMYKAVQDDMQTLFGKNTEQSMLPTLKNAMQGLSSGNVENFNRVVSAIPKSMRNEVLTTALQNMFTRAGSNELGPFGFQQFSRFFKSFKQDSASMNALMGNLDPETRSTLSKLIKVSDSVSNSISQKIYTGRSRFAKDLVAELNNVPTTMIDSVRSWAGPAAGKVIGHTGAAVAYKVPVVGPVLAPVAHGVGNFASWVLTPNKTPVEKALSDFMLSDEARDILQNGPKATPQQMQTAANSPTFRRVAQLARGAAANDPQMRERWLRGIVGAVGQESPPNNR